MKAFCKWAVPPVIAVIALYLLDLPTWYAALVNFWIGACLITRAVSLENNSGSIPRYRKPDRGPGGGKLTRDDKRDAIKQFGWVSYHFGNPDRLITGLYSFLGLFYICFVTATSNDPSLDGIRFFGLILYPITLITVLYDVGYAHRQAQVLGHP